jgi:predicted Zn-dependent protease
VSRLEGAGDIPEWTSTHPNPGNRVEATQARLDTLSVPLSQLKTDRDKYLPVIAGMTYGEDPKQGYLDGNTFYHPDLRFQLQLPQGWQAQNTPQALAAVSPKQDALFELTAPGKGSPEEAARQFFSQEGIRSTQASTQPINGLPAASSYFEAQTEQGAIQGVVAFIQYGDLTYRLLGYSPAAQFQANSEAFRRAIGSFTKLSDPKRIDVEPYRVELVKVDRDMSMAEFNQKYPSTIPVERLAVVNGLDAPPERIPAGTTVKRIVGGKGAPPLHQAGPANTTGQ